ncbi:hypothetical protein Q2K19_21985 [Micromonospora soli]|uniref:effector-associated constant component EACC1 n=1 Tax=Micromonospora sp. NBRC 110009 TaxID=3061627 RepID=UPI0026711437|nr:hypothetical protein [Micromonospora sp. NBRC 110009]WKT96850.1 hypothetical protein Q2K19_21985 [Micromonospora sp. NBRC 110009]
MQLILQVPVDQAELLLQWLIDEPQLRRGVSLDDGAVGQGHMGAELGTLAVALGSGGAVTALVGSLSAWLQRSKMSTTIEIADGKGLAIKVSSSDPVRAAALLEHAATQIQLLIEEANGQQSKPLTEVGEPAPSQFRGDDRA